VAAGTPKLFDSGTGGALAGKASRWTDADVIAALPATRADVAAKLGMSVPTAVRRVRRLHERKLVHVERWEPAAAPGPWQALYAPGPGLDAKHPPKYVPYVKKAGKAPPRAGGTGEAAAALAGGLFGGRR
jgi:hypothetical protein